MMSGLWQKVKRWVWIDWRENELRYVRVVFGALVYKRVSELRLLTVLGVPIYKSVGTINWVSSAPLSGYPWRWR